MRQSISSVNYRRSKLFITDLQPKRRRRRKSPQPKTDLTVTRATHQAQQGKCVKRRRKSPKSRRGRRSEFGLEAFNGLEACIGLEPLIASLEAIIDVKAVTLSN